MSNLKICQTKKNKEDFVDLLKHSESVAIKLWDNQEDKIWDTKFDKKLALKALADAKKIRKSGIFKGTEGTKIIRKWRNKRR